ncbi:MAG: phosphotransferase, partial [Actinomycetota bacterium]|nr:phosphotransferase [Actinomycetota bacterium]
ACDPNPAPWLEGLFMFLFERLPLGGVSWLLDRLIGLGAKSKRRYLLLMEDIHDARPPSQVEGGSVDDALSGLRVLARFHAANWMCQDVLDAHPILWPLDRAPKVLQASYRRSRDEFVERFGELIGPELVAKMDEIQDRLPELAERMIQEPWALMHGDYRLDNLMFRSDGEIAVLDWQGVGWARPGWDVAYFITTALEPHHSAEEELMLRTYHEVLLAAGVDSYSYDDLVTDATLTKELLLHRMVAGDELLDTAMEGHDDGFVEVLVERIAGWVEA